MKTVGNVLSFYLKVFYLLSVELNLFGLAALSPTASLFA